MLVNSLGPSDAYIRQKTNHHYSSDNGLAPGRRQAIIWTIAGILLIGPLGTNFSELIIEIHTFSFKKMQLKMSSGKWRPFCLGLNVFWRSLGLWSDVIEATLGRSCNTYTPVRFTTENREVVITKTCRSTINNNVGIMKTIGFQWQSNQIISSVARLFVCIPHSDYTIVNG